MRKYKKLYLRTAELWAQEIERRKVWLRQTFALTEELAVVRAHCIELDSNLREMARLHEYDAERLHLKELLDG